MFGRFCARFASWVGGESFQSLQTTCACSNEKKYSLAVSMAVLIMSTAKARTRKEEIETVELSAADIREAVRTVSAPFLCPFFT